MTLPSGEAHRWRSTAALVSLAVTITLTAGGCGSSGGLPQTPQATLPSVTAPVISTPAVKAAGGQTGAPSSASPQATAGASGGSQAAGSQAAADQSAARQSGSSDGRKPSTAESDSQQANHPGGAGGATSPAQSQKDKAGA